MTYPSGVSNEEWPHEDEPHESSLASRLNWLRAGVLGANDGIISTAGLVVGVAGATTDRSWLLVTGLAGLVAGAFSMAGGEYASVSAQRDTERAALAKERWELQHLPEEELLELVGLLQAQGLSLDVAQRAAHELTESDALAAHARLELGIDAHEQTNPWHAAISSFIAFGLGAMLPLLAIVLPSTSLRVPITMITVAAALALTGFVSARLGGSNPAHPMLRNVVVGALTMSVTYVVGMAIGTTV